MARGDDHDLVAVDPRQSLALDLIRHAAAATCELYRWQVPPTEADLWALAEAIRRGADQAAAGVPEAHLAAITPAWLLVEGTRVGQAAMVEVMARRLGN